MFPAPKFSSALVRRECGLIRENYSFQSYEVFRWNGSQQINQQLFEIARGSEVVVVFDDLRSQSTPPYSNSFITRAIFPSRSSTFANTVPPANAPSPFREPALIPVKTSIPSSIFPTGQI
jgi:hypothetical protein